MATRGRIHATAGTCELASLVLLDSGHLHEEFAKREARWEKRHPDLVEADDRKESVEYQAAVDLAAAGGSEEGAVETKSAPASAVAAATSTAEAMTADAGETAGTGEHVETTVQPEPPVDWATHDPEAELRRQPPMLQIDLDEPLYTVKDAEKAIDHFRPIDYDQEQEVAPGVWATFLDAGHILGSAIIRLRIQDGGEERVVICSGDLGRPGTPIIRDPTYLTDADYVLVESTYGGREHEPQEEAIRILAETVRLVAEADGVLLVPSFAIGRTQEVVWELDRLIERGEIPSLPLYLDSPMATKATGIYRRYSRYFDEETARLLQEGATPLDYPAQVVINTPKESQAIQFAARPYMIVASNGMLTGGRVVGHLRNLIDDPKATLLFVGYQGEGTLGAHLQAGAKTVRLDGQPREVRCKVRSIAGFSAHADEGELLDWIGRFAKGKQRGGRGFPKTVFLVHGDPEAQQAMEPKVRALGFETHVPHWHERVTLD